jgi:hypothetical protein
MLSLIVNYSRFPLLSIFKDLVKDGLVYNYGGRYRWADTSPTLTDCLWFNALVVGWNITDSNCTRRMLLFHWCNFGGIPRAVEIPCSWVEPASGAPDGRFNILWERKAWALAHPFGEKPVCGSSPTKQNAIHTREVAWAQENRVKRFAYENAMVDGCHIHSLIHFPDISETAYIFFC